MLLIAADWPMESHDLRHTSQADVSGPRSAHSVSLVTLTGESVINMPLTIAGDGTLFAVISREVISSPSTPPPEHSYGRSIRRSMAVRDR